MTFAILGLGTAVPSTTIDQNDALHIARACCCRSAKHAAWLPVMYGNSQIQKRHLAIDAGVVRDVITGTRATGSPFLPSGTHEDRGPTTAERMRHYIAEAGPLAAAAAGRALDRAGLAPTAITHLVTVSCTGFHAPGIDTELIQRLRLPPGTLRTHIGFMGCHGALNGLRVAKAFAEADDSARVLLCCVELCSLHYHYGWDPQQVIANAIFADGAAAVVGAGRPDVVDNASWRLAGSGSCLFSDSANEMIWRVGDHGFEMRLSKKVPGLIAQQLRPWLADWLASQGIALDEVGSWAIHPGGPRILGAVEEGLGLPAQTTRTSRAVFTEFGNMSSPTVLFIVERLAKEEQPRPCVALGFGPGLTVEAALFQ
jgi:predicted naringenin-chalcone synthase